MRWPARQFPRLAMLALVPALAGCGWHQGGAMEMTPEVARGRGDLTTVGRCVVAQLSAAKRAGEECEHRYEYWTVRRTETEWKIACDMTDYLGAVATPLVYGSDPGSGNASFGMDLRDLGDGRIESRQWVLFHLTAVPNRQRILHEAFAACAAPE